MLPNGPLRVLVLSVRFSSPTKAHDLTEYRREAFAESSWETRYVPVELSTPLFRLTGAFTSTSARDPRNDDYEQVTSRLSTTP